MTVELQMRSKTTTTGLRGLLIMAYSDSDIGTSPLYVLNGIFPATGPLPPDEDVIGGVSCIVWALTLLPLIKYSIIALSFGSNDGEGGVFQLWATLFPRRGPSDEDRQLTRYSTQEGKSDTPDGQLATNRLGYATLARSKWPLMVWALFGTSLILADGILTPAVSVVSAVGGIAVAKPSVLESVVPISIAFLLVLFLVQSFGTKKISYAFAPVTIIWLALLGMCGILNVIKAPQIFRAFDPSRAVMFFVRTGDYGALAGVILCVTGCEAIFANLGQFTAASIRIGFFYAYACITLNYLGQGARIITDGEKVMSSLFYLTIPGPTGGPLYWIMYIFAVLACLVASQTMITACFSLVQQLINFDACPRFRMKHTSATNQGQIYFAAINYALGIAVIATVGGFGTAYALTNAYGFAVATVMFVTTTLLTLSIPFVKNLPWPVAIAFFLFFGFIDGCFWGASLKKVPEGAWFALSIGCLLTISTAFYTWGRHQENLFDSANHRKLSHIITRSPDVKSASARFSKSSSAEDEGKYELEPMHSRSGPSGLKVLRRTNKTTTSPDDEIDLEEEDDDSDEADFIPDERLFLTIPSGQLALPRISTMALFHKTSHSRGIPHAFSSFLQRWPALPRVVIFLSTQVVGLPHVSVEDRYDIVKVRSLQGFYAVNVRLGYRDARPAYSEEILERLRGIEAAWDKTNAEKNMLEIEEAGKNVTHILPNYVLQSKPTRFALISMIRKILVEELYARIRTMFPDESSAAESGDDVIHIGVNAQI